jgi:hypothetical protein
MNIKTHPPFIDRLTRNRVKTEPDEKHQGQNLKRFREMLGFKQEYLATELGPGWSQKRISLLEGKEIIDDEQLAAVAEKLGTTPHIIRYFSERVARACVRQLFERTTNSPQITDALHDAGASPGAPLNNESQNFLDYCMTMAQERKRLYEELLQTERKYVAVLEKLTATAVAV